MFTGEESLGKPYVYEVSFMSPVLLEVETLVDTNVKILLQDVKAVDKQREFFGKVYQAEHTDSVGDKHLYTFTVVHPLYYLGLNRRYEIYQDQSAFDVMQTLLTRYKGLLGIDFHTNITPSYFTKREYTTQYDQSDLEFIQMLCEQEGVTLHMETGESTHKVRLAHINETFTELHTELRCNYNSTKAFRVTHTQENYYDFRIPSKEYLKETGASALLLARWRIWFRSLGCSPLVRCQALVVVGEFHQPQGNVGFPHHQN
jgi:type VI secretion system secreted protein VgrG